MSSGWIKLHRKVFNSPVVNKDCHHFYLWAYLLCHAAHTPIKAFFGDRLVALEAGQLITGRKKMAIACGINENKIERILKLLKNEQLIEQQASSKSRLITIKNWKIYQQNEQQNEQQTNNKRTANEQQVNTIKEDKELKELNKYYLPAKAGGCKKILKTFLKNFYKKEVVLNIRVNHYFSKWPEPIIKLALGSSACVSEAKFIECLSFFAQREKMRSLTEKEK